MNVFFGRALLCAFAFLFLCFAVVSCTGKGADVTDSSSDTVNTKETTSVAATSGESSITAEDLDLSLYNVISVEEYTDRTTAGFLGQLAGFFSGYEFVWNADKTPRIALPDAWFFLCNGPYAGNSAYQTHTNRLIYNKETGIYEVHTDDDYHIDILNQYILKDSFESYAAVSCAAILRNWRYYQVSDWGGGSQDVGAMKLMASLNLLPPFTGRSEYGNICHWLTEPYIENETLGMNAPGMPNTAVELTSVFANVTGDYENVMWAKFYAAMYSMAYFEDDVYTLIEEASKVFPEGCFPRDIIRMCREAYEKYPNDWRAAVIEIEEKAWRNKFGMTGQTDSGTNGAFAVLSLLYGGGKYTETCKIASLAGYDGDCTAAIVTGIVGIIAGMENTPKAVMQKLWKNGDSVFVNEAKGDWTARFRANFPERTPVSEIIDLYRQNFEFILKNNGGYVIDGNYYIPKSTLKTARGIPVVNGDFESGTINNFTFVPGSSNDKITVDSSGAVTGDYGVKIYGNASTEAKLYTVVTGLKPGELYSLSAYISATASQKAVLFAEGTDSVTRFSCSVYSQSAFARRELVFKATGETMRIGIMRSAGKAVLGYITADDFLLQQISEEYLYGVDFAGKNALALSEGRKGLKCSGVVQATVNCTEPDIFEYLLKIDFANESLAVVYANIAVDGEKRGAAPFYKTGASILTSVENNYVYIPLALHEGENTISIDFGVNNINIYDAVIVRRSDMFTQ